MNCDRCDARDIELTRLKTLMRRYISMSENASRRILLGETDPEGMMESLRKQLNLRATLLRMTKDAGDAEPADAEEETL